MLMDWIITTANWYLYLLLIGFVFIPLTSKIFHSFFDKGYPFAKIIGVIILTYLSFVLGIYKIAPFNRLTLAVFLVAAFIFQWIIINRRTSAHAPFHFNKQMWIFIFEELLFIVSLFFLTYIRGQEPSIRGLEKYMDFGFINSILRSTHFPPLDIWYSRLPINYYYFGHLSGAILIKLSGMIPSYGYNLILATIFAQAVTAVFSLVGSVVYSFRKSFKLALFMGLMGTFIVNFGGNLHTVYLFTQGYPADATIPFWKIFSGYDPTKYWYPNATRFIPFTIHEFPIYSYVVADLHGHVFDIPFVLLTIALLFLMFTHKQQANILSQTSKIKSVVGKFFHSLISTPYSLYTFALGFMTALHYMTNAFDGPIYLLLIALTLFVMFGFKKELFFYMTISIISFLVFSYPFSSHFSPFVSGIGVNCSPEILTNIKKFGPFLFEKGNCQPDPFWMLFVLWGFVWINFLLFFFIKVLEGKTKHALSQYQMRIDDFIFVLFTFGTILILIPEFFYIKDIYPAHFRANTMFKMGYQAFIMMGMASAYTCTRIFLLHNKVVKTLFMGIFLFFFSFIFIYPFYAYPSYYGTLKKTPQLDGSEWITGQFPEDKEIIDYLNYKVKNQPTILEAQGDSYTDYERISAYTGLPTVAGWWVHEWLWRGSSEIVGKRIPEVVALYESADQNETRRLLEKYGIEYVVISRLEKEKYKNLNEEKFKALGKKVFGSSNGLGALYQVKNK